MIDFPASPTDGQLFTTAGNGVVYKYSAAYSSWLAQNPAPQIGGTGDFFANQTSAFPVLNNAYTTQVLTQVANGNSGNWYNAANGRYTPPAGRYWMFGRISALNSSGATHIQCRLLKNGTTVVLEGLQSSSAASTYGEPVIGGNIDANGADFFELQGFSSTVTGTNTTVALVFGAHPLTGMQGPPGVISNGYRLISRIVPTAAQASVDFTSLPSDINDLMVHFDVTPTQNSKELQLRFYNAGGTVDATGPYSWANSVVGHTANRGATVTSTGSAGDVLYPNGILFDYAVTNRVVGNVSGIRGRLSIPNIQSARFKSCFHQAEYVSDDTSVLLSMSGTGCRNVAGAITGLNFTFISSGTFAAGGAISLWGSP